MHAFLRDAMFIAYFTPVQAVLLSLLLASLSSSSAATCSSLESFPNNKSFALCEDLPHLRASLHWTYDSSKSSLHVAFVAPPASPNGWISWAINPTKTGMVGAQALIGFNRPDGSMTVNTSDIKAYGPIEISAIAFKASSMEGDLMGGKMRIYATLQLPEKMKLVNQVWQVGGLVKNGVPGVHEFEYNNLNSVGTLDLVSGKSVVGNAGESIPTDKKIHGILNVVGWGILMPIGALVARHLKRVESAGASWFYVHVSCQCSAYIMAVIGFATGLVLGKKSVGVEYSRHRYIGIALFVLGTLQSLAIFWRPKPGHKYRFYWNWYHHSIGYTAMIMSALNIFLGLLILGADKKWRSAYAGVVCALFGVAVLLEMIRRIRCGPKQNQKQELP